MSQMIEVKVAELVGAALDWAVFCSIYPGMRPTIAITEAAKLERKPFIKPIEFPRVVRLTYTGAYDSVIDWAPSTDWEQCGPLISKHVVEISAGDIWQEDGGGTWSAITITDRDDAEHSVAYAYGDTPLQAICRVIVVANIGDVVSVPAELMEAA